MSDQLKLFCWVLGISHEPLSVEIEKDKTVDDLKEKIVKEKPSTFENVEADTLTLWQVSDTLALVQSWLISSEGFHPR
jgi:hypothetical protein